MRVLALLLLIFTTSTALAKTFEGYGEASSIITLQDSIYRVRETKTEFLILLSGEHAFLHFPKTNVQPEKMRKYLNYHQQKKTRLKFEVNAMATKVLRIIEV